MSRSGRSPNASSARRAVPNRFVTRRNSEPDVREQQRRPAGGDDPAVDLGNLQMRIDRDIDRNDICVAAERLDERAKVREHEIDD